LGQTLAGTTATRELLRCRRSLTFKPAPGRGSDELIPDLAEGLGVPSDGGKTFTYKLRKGVKYEDGTEVKAADVKYAVLRSTDKETFPNGPAYFEQFLNLPEGYKGPYKTPDMNTDSAITTPDDQTIVFTSRWRSAALTTRPRCRLIRFRTKMPVKSATSSRAARTCSTPTAGQSFL
jgi:peptide/nickel transport system substrate-binding protein